MEKETSSWNLISAIVFVYITMAMLFLTWKKANFFKVNIFNTISHKGPTCENDHKKYYQYSTIKYQFGINKTTHGWFSEDRLAEAVDK